jgi:hypothetical protein
VLAREENGAREGQVVVTGKLAISIPDCIVEQHGQADAGALG